MLTNTRTFYEELSKGCRWNTCVVIVECAHKTFVNPRHSLGEVESVRVFGSHWVIEYGGTISINDDSSVYIPPNCSGRSGGGDTSYTCWRFSISRILYFLHSNTNCEQIMDSSVLFVCEWSVVDGGGFHVCSVQGILHHNNNLLKHQLTMNLCIVRLNSTHVSLTCIWLIVEPNINTLSRARTSVHGALIHTGDS